MPKWPAPPKQIVKAKFSLLEVQNFFRQLLLDGKTRIVVLDVYMGDPTTTALRQHIFKPLRKEFPDATFDIVWLRETFGREKLGKEGPELRPFRSNLHGITNHSIEVRIVLGDDMNIVMDRTPGSTEPIRIFDSRGRIIRIESPRPVKRRARY